MAIPCRKYQIVVGGGKTKTNHNDLIKRKGMNTTIKEFYLVVKNAIGDKAKLLQYELEKLGWKRRLRWIYQQGENIDGRESIVQRFLIFMVGLKRSNYQGFEYLRFEIDLFLNQETIGHPTPERLIEGIIDQIAADIKKVKLLLNR